MEETNQSLQYQECNLENMKALLSELFEQEVSSDYNLQLLCSNDVNKLDVIKDGISRRFGVCVTIEDIVRSNSIEEFTRFVIEQINSPRFPFSEKELRKEQLSEIARNNNLNSLFKELVDAGQELKKSKEEIDKINAPINLVGHHFKNKFINTILDGADPKVGRGELKDVVRELDKNTKDAVTSLSKAVECTNKWINEICNMLLWIIQIENDIYGITEESSIETLRLSKLLSQEGVNIEGLTEVAAMEQSKRQRMKQQIKEFKSDVEGKIEFLNNVHKNLLSQFEEHKKEIQDEFVSANNALEQKIGSYFSDLNNKFSKLLNETKDNLQQLQQVLKSEQVDFFEKAKNEISKIDERTSLYMKEQSAVIDKLQKRNNIYRAISVSAIIVSIATILYVFLR